MTQVRHHAEVFMTFSWEAWTPERDGFLDAIFSHAVQRAGAQSYRPLFAPRTPPSADEFNALARAKVTTITPEPDGAAVRVGIVVEGWVDDDDSGDWD